MKTTVDEVIKTYHDTKSIRKTSKLTGYSKSGVEYILKKNGITLFHKNRSGSENSSAKAIQNLDASDPRRLVRNQQYMEELYLQKKMSIPEISNLLQVSKTTVITGLQQCGIQRRTKSQSISGKSRPNAQGSKNINWKGGLTGWRKLARGRLNEHFVRPIMQRDNFTCQWCSSKKDIVVHHSNRTFMEIVNIVKPDVKESDVELFVSAIVAEHRLEDGITLCKLCHDKHHKENGK